MLEKYRRKIIDSKEFDAREAFEVELTDLCDQMTMWAQTENVVGITSRIPTCICSLNTEYRNRGVEFGILSLRCLWNMTTQIGDLI